MFVALSSTGNQTAAGQTLEELISQLKQQPDGTYKIFRQVAEVVRLPEVLVIPADVTKN